MLKYIGPDGKMLRSSGYDNQVVTKILIKETDVHHSGTYQCEPGASPSAKVNVHVLDGKYEICQYCGAFQIRILACH